MDARGGEIAASTQPAIPLLINARDEKALPHLGEREIAGAFCWEGFNHLLRACDVSDRGACRRLCKTECFWCCALVFVKPLLTEPLYVQSVGIYWLLEKFLFAGAYFSLPLTGEVSR